MSCPGRMMRDSLMVSQYPSHGTIGLACIEPMAREKTEVMAEDQTAARVGFPCGYAVARTQLTCRTTFCTNVESDTHRSDHCERHRDKEVPCAFTHRIFMSRNLRRPRLDKRGEGMNNWARKHVVPAAVSCDEEAVVRR